MVLKKQIVLERLKALDTSLEELSQPEQIGRGLQGVVEPEMDD